MNSLSRREFGLLTGVGALGASIPETGAAASTALAQIDPASFINPEYHPWLEIIKATANGPVATVASLPASRSKSNPLLKPPMASPTWTKQTIPGPTDAPDVTIYIINAGQKSSPRPAILHMHGGGFVFLNAVSFLQYLQEIAAALDCVIVTVDYRLAPETPFPGSLEDNYAALKWLYSHAGELGADPKRIAVMGESAGGGHAAMLAIAARDRGEVPIAFQALIYPMLDDRTGSVRMPPPQVGAFIWRPADNRFSWTCLLGEPAGSPKVPYGAVPSRVENLGGLAPAFIAVGSIDLFVEESIDYARRLTDAVVPVELHVYPGCFHAFDMMPMPTAVAARFKDDRLTALKNAFQQKVL